MTERLSSGLRTPRLSEAPERDKRELLLACRQLQDIKSTYEATGKTFIDATMAASSVSELVRQSLFFSSTGSGPDTPLLRAEQLAETAATNCFGHALVASELLEEVGISHYIAYANQHIFLLLADHYTNQVTMVDPVGFTGDITHAISGQPLQQQLQYKDRAQNVLYTDDILAGVAEQGDPEIFRAVRPWMSFAKHDDPRFREGNERDYQLQLLTYDMVRGREVMWQLYDAIVWQRRGQYSKAAEAYMMLPHGLYPDIDPRNQYGDIQKTAQALISKGLGGQALQLVAVLSDSLSPDDTSKNRYIIGDTQRTLARWYKNRNIPHELIMFAIPMLQAALAEYDTIYNQSSGGPRRLAAGKQQAAKKELQVLQSMLQ
ncbi:MAG: hypothetical protein Q4A37_02590 [Candidatus Saccharibacteria bacterium]|nr:hypothetical protein [Candidatus Saccharibacteria bacterium]